MQPRHFTFVHAPRGVRGLISPVFGVQAGQARRIEELQAAISQRDATELQEDCSNGASVVHHAGADVPGPAQRPLLNDAMAVKTSLDNNMLRPLLSNARAHSCSAADAPGTPEKTAQFVTNAASPVAIPSELSSFLIRSQEKRRHFSSSLKQLMRSASTEHEGACGELLEKQITIGLCIFESIRIISPVRADV